MVKLVRVLMLGPVVLGLSLLTRRARRDADDAPRGKWPAFQELVPWFILGFLFFALARSLGFIPGDLVRPLRTIAAVLTTIAMAALGLGVDVRTVAKAGPRVATAVTALARRARGDQLRADPARGCRPRAVRLRTACPNPSRARCRRPAIFRLFHTVVDTVS